MSNPTSKYKIGDLVACRANKYWVLSPIDDVVIGWIEDLHFVYFEPIDYDPLYEHYYQKNYYTSYAIRWADRIHDKYPMYVTDEDIDSMVELVNDIRNDKI